MVKIKNIKGYSIINIDGTSTELLSEVACGIEDFICLMSEKMNESPEKILSLIVSSLVFNMKS